MKQLIIILLYLLPAVIEGQVEPSVTYDSITGNYICEYMREDSLVQVVFEPSTKLKPLINSNVNQSLYSGAYIYSYTIKNGNASKQRLRKFGIEIFAEITKSSTPNKYWRTGYYSFVSVFRWAHSIGSGGVANPLDGVAPDSLKSGFGFSSLGLPSITSAYFYGSATIPLAFPDEPPGEISELLKQLRKFPNNCIIKKAVSPKDPPLPFIPQEFFDTLITYTDSSYALGWITNEQTRDKYDNYFNNAKNYLNQNNNNVAKSGLQKVLTDCNTDSSTVLTSEAYALLYFNTEYLLTKIEDGGPNVNSLSGSIKVSVTKTDSINTFGYTVTNSDTSSQAIKNIYVGNESTVQSVNLPTSWTNINNLATLNLIGFNTQLSGILAGAAQSGFNVSANGLPTLGNVYLQSQRNNVDSADIFENSFIAETLVPTSKPEVFNPVAFVDTLIYYNNKSLSNNWLTAEWVKTVFESSLNNAKLFINQKLYTSAVPVMQQLITILDSYKTGGFVKEEAYYLLKINSQYLLDKLNILAVTPPAEAVAQLDSVFAANELNKTNSWYSADWVYTTLTSILNNAKITLNQNNIAGTKLVIQQFVITLDSYKTSGFITEEGYINIKPKCLILIEMLQ